MPTSASFTARSNKGLQRQLRTPCHLTPAFDPRTVPQEQHPAQQTFSAIWDTGATGSVITRKIVNALGLKPIGMCQMMHASGVSPSERYLVNIILPQGVRFVNVPVVRGDITGADMLVGMDIITRGDFSVTNQGGVTMFSFRYPSLTTVDYVADDQRRAQQAQSQSQPASQAQRNAKKRERKAKKHKKRFN